MSLLAGLIIFYLFKTLIDIRDFAEVLKRVDILLLFSTIIVSFSVPVLSAFRWQFVLRLVGHDTSFKQSFSIVMSVWPLSILPGRVGDFARSYPLRNQIEPMGTAGAVLFEKVIDVASLLLLSAVGFLFLGHYGYAVILFLLSTMTIPMLFLTRSVSRFLPQSLSLKLRPIFTHLEFKNLKSKYFLFSLISSLTNWWVSVLMIWFLYDAFGASLPMTTTAAYFPLAIFIGLIPISIAGLGTRDSALIAFFIDKATPAQSLASGIGYFLIGYILFAIIGIPFFIKNFFSTQHTDSQKAN